MAGQALARFNPATGRVWVEFDNGPTVQLSDARSAREAYQVIGRADLVRWSNWIPSYGPVRECRVGISARG